MYIVLSGHISASPPDMRPKWLAILIEMGPGTEESDQILTVKEREERGIRVSCVALQLPCQPTALVHANAAYRPLRPNAQSMELPLAAPPGQMPMRNPSIPYIHYSAMLKCIRPTKGSRGSRGDQLFPQQQHAKRARTRNHEWGKR